MDILIVEDDPNLGALWGAAFGALSHDVTTTGTAQAARKALMTRTFDLVLLDLYLGRDSGLSVAALATYTNPFCKMVVVTGAGEYAYERLVDLSPAIVSVLRKPVDIEHLLAVCDHIDRVRHPQVRARLG